VENFFNKIHTNILKFVGMNFVCYNIAPNFSSPTSTATLVLPVAQNAFRSIVSRGEICESVTNKFSDGNFFLPRLAVLALPALRYGKLAHRSGLRFTPAFTRVASLVRVPRG